MATKHKPAADAPTPKPNPASRAAARNTGTKGSPDAANSPRDEALAPGWAQAGEVLTTSHGARLSDTDNSLRAGARGPALLEDFHLREKIMHFDHERIPERVVHARGAGAHGRFELYESLDDLTTARFLCDTKAVTPMFVRFSTVAGSRGSADTARDVRGFAAKFYTAEGNFDLVGNNMPIFFIQDGIKFPDLIHAAKPEPDREIPQAQTAHDTFWDFASLTPESTAMLMWIMSDRAIPRSYRTMEGFGVHTFRLVNAKGETSLVKFHWKPVAGTHSLVWEEAQKLGGIDPDFHRRDLWNAIENGAFPEWELGLQVLPDDDDQTFAGIDLLDATKLVPEELAPVRLVGKMTLDGNPSNFFAETEQVAFHTGHLVPGIDITDDPLLHARMFSYLDTQLLRLGGPNFGQLPINRPASQVNDDQRDGFGQQAVHQGRTAYSPNSIGGGCPFTVGAEAGGYVHVPRQVDGPKVRQRAASFDDHFSQATLFWLSLKAPERDHVVGAFSFELSKVSAPEIVTRTLENLANVDAELTERVAANLGVPAPSGSPATDVDASPALSMIPLEPGPIAGRVVGILAADGADGLGIIALAKGLDGADALGHVVAPHGGQLDNGATVDRTFHSSESVELDAVIVAGGSGVTLAADPQVLRFVQEAYRHSKVVGAWGDGTEVLAAAGISPESPGVIGSDKANKAFTGDVIEAVGWHRFFEREAAI